MYKIVAPNKVTFQQWKIDEQEDIVRWWYALEQEHKIREQVVAVYGVAMESLTNSFLAETGKMVERKIQGRVIQEDGTEVQKVKFRKCEKERGSLWAWSVVREEERWDFKESLLGRVCR